MLQYNPNWHCKNYRSGHNFSQSNKLFIFCPWCILTVKYTGPLLHWWDRAASRFPQHPRPSTEQYNDSHHWLPCSKRPLQSGRCGDTAAIEWWSGDRASASPSTHSSSATTASWTAGMYRLIQRQMAEQILFICGSKIQPPDAVLTGSCNAAD